MLCQAQEEEGSYPGNGNDEGSEECGFPFFLGPVPQTGLHPMTSVFP